MDCELIQRDEPSARHSVKPSDAVITSLINYSGPRIDLASTQINFARRAWRMDAPFLHEHHGITDILREQFARCDHVMKEQQHYSLADTTLALADLQALVLAQGAMLDTLIATHPHPVELREAWDQRVSSVLALSLQSQAARLAQGERSRALQPLSRQLHELTEKVLKRAPRAE